MRSTLSAIVGREYHPKTPLPIHPGYRGLVRKIYRRAGVRGRKAFRTTPGGVVNPVYDIQFSPGIYPDHRVMGVADELGNLSIVKVALEGGCGGGGGEQERVFNRGVVTVSPRGEEQQESLTPLLYTLDWNEAGNKILTGYGDGSLRVWDLEKGGGPTCTCALPAYEKSLKRVCWSEGGTFISCSRTNEILVHDQRMRKALANRVDCGQLGAKLTDICVLNDSYVVASASNQSAVHLFDLRFTYKLYKRIKPVESFELRSPGYTSMAYDSWTDEGVLYALGSDAIIRSFDYRTGKPQASFGVPGGVDFFTKVSVDRGSGVLLTGGSGDRAFGYDLTEPWELGVAQAPFFTLREGTRGNAEEETEEDKENSVPDGESGRCSSAVALATRRGWQDCAVQMATGGDNSAVIVFD